MNYAEVEPPAVVIPQQLPQILIVEDNPIDVKLISWGLRRAGFGGEPIVVNDGREALSVLRREGPFKNETLPDLVILDLNLRLLDGPEVLQFIRDTPELSKTRVAILSSSPEDVMRGAAAKADYYFSKSASVEAYEGVGKQMLAALSDKGSIIWHGFLADIAERKQFAADQQFLADLSAKLQMARSPEAIAELATDSLVDHFDAARCSLSSINVPKGEATCLHESTRHDAVVLQGGTRALTSWAEERILGVMAAGNTIAVGNTATDPITAIFYATTYQPLNIEALLAVSLRREGQWVAALALATQEPRSWSDREIDLARSAAERIWGAYEVSRAVAAERSMHGRLAASEDRLRLALQSAAIGIWENNLVSQEMHWDSRARAIFGFPADGKIDEKQAISCIHPDDRELVLENDRPFRDPGGDGRFSLEYRIITADQGRLLHVCAQGQAFFEGHGPDRKAVRLVGTVQDITERKTVEIAIKRSLDEKQALLQEIHHRVKNNLQIISSLLSMQAERVGDKEVIAQFADSGRRIRSMAMIHEHLYHENDMSSIDLAKYVEDLAAHVFSTCTQEQSIRYRVEATSTPVGLDKAVPCGLILNELMTNALKYAYPEGTGEVLVHVSSEAGWVSFKVSDQGVGLPAGFDAQACTTLGMTLVDALVGQLDGELHINSLAGASFSVRFPNLNAGRWSH